MFLGKNGAAVRSVIFLPLCISFLHRNDLVEQQIHLSVVLSSNNEHIAHLISRSRPKISCLGAACCVVIALHKHGVAFVDEHRVLLGPKVLLIPCCDVVAATASHALCIANLEEDFGPCVVEVVVQLKGTGAFFHHATACCS